MRTAIVAAIGWLTFYSSCHAQNCALSAGNKVAATMQNCGSTPPMTLLKPPLGQPLVAIDGPQGTFLYQVFVKVAGPIDIRVAACGDDVTNVDGRLDNSATVSVSALHGLPKNCVGKQLDQIISGTWRLEGVSKSKDKPVQIEAVVGDFARSP
jgi:hypothetical protein